MKTRSLRTFLMLNVLVTLAVVSVTAQTYRTKGTIIPFSFTVGEKMLPAGEYTVERFGKNSEIVWLVRSRDGRDKVVVQTNPVRSIKSEGKGQLVFRRYGDRYVLTQIWTGGETGRELRTPRFRDELGQNNVKPETVVIATSAN
jgi:hypothetical protein